MDIDTDSTCARAHNTHKRVFKCTQARKQSPSVAMTLADRAHPPERTVYWQRGKYSQTTAPDRRAWWWDGLTNEMGTRSAGGAGRF